MAPRHPIRALRALNVRARRERRGDKATDPGGPRRECQVIERLEGQRIPSLFLATFQEEPVDLGSFGLGFVAIYVYPGSKGGPDGGKDTPTLDAVEHLAFSSYGQDMRALNILVFGLSTESLEDQLERTSAIGIGHSLLSDPHLLLAEKLELPVFEDSGQWWYRRLTLVVSDGRIKKVFYPVQYPARSPAQVVAWAKVQSR